jgi:hypothetical protein
MEQRMEEGGLRGNRRVQEVRTTAADSEQQKQEEQGGLANQHTVRMAWRVEG